MADTAAGDMAGAAERPPGRVLIVEDEYLVAIASEDALAAAGFAVVRVVDTAESAVAAAEAHRPDIVLMDIHLAGARDGVDAAAEIMARFGIPSVFATAHSDLGMRVRGERAARPVGWLAKPFTAEEVVAAATAGVALARQRQRQRPRGH